jgi:D-amino peptidase
MRKGICVYWLVLALSSWALASGKGPLKVFVSVDLEGIWGVVHSEQTSAEYGGYGAACRWMAEDVNAVVAGLLEAGATEVVVNDSHGSMRNLRADELHPRASLISGTPKPLSMMEGIDASFAACLFIGYHARAGSAAAVLDHTISGGTVRSIRINGQEMPELGINGALAGYFQVPVIMISGDTETCGQARAILGDGIVTAAVKEGIGRTAARMLPAAEARQLLKDKAKEALAKRDKIPCCKIKSPVNVELEFLRSSQAELPLLLPQVKRIDARAVGFSSRDLLEGFKLMRAVIILAGQG